MSELFRRDDFQNVRFFFTVLLIGGEPDMAIYVLGTNDPGNVFHIPPAGDAFIAVVRAVPYLERHKPCGPQEGTEHNLFALRVTFLDVRPVAGVTEGVAAARRPTLPDRTHIYFLTGSWPELQS
jgi:hypothetical protein